MKGKEQRTGIEKGILLTYNRSRRKRHMRRMK